ncbi:MAG: hypothetical protein MIO92_05725 [Methanosarcinaceae archaeon]|nr:hypothetical protein [Methanosarcinaceae archaeon]
MGIKDNILNSAPEPEETITSLLIRMGIPAEEVYSIFVNHKLLFTRSIQAKWTGHQKARENPFDPDLDVPVTQGYRIGLFGSDMALLVV